MNDTHRSWSRWIAGGIATLTWMACGAVTQIPEKVIGIWTTDGTMLKGDVVTSGQAIYIDIDGIGAMMSSNGGKTLNQRLVVTEYSESAGRLEVDVTQHGQVTGHLSLNFDAGQDALVSPDEPSSLYHRRKLEMSPDVRAALGLEPRPLSIPSLQVPRTAGNAASAVP